MPCNSVLMKSVAIDDRPAASANRMLSKGLLQMFYQVLTFKVVSSLILTDVL